MEVLRLRARAFRYSEVKLLLLFRNLIRKKIYRKISIKIEIEKNLTLLSRIIDLYTNFNYIQM